MTASYPFGFAIKHPQKLRRPIRIFPLLQCWLRIEKVFEVTAEDV